MSPKLMLYGGAVLIAFGLLLSAYFKGKSVVREEFDAYKLVAQVKYDAQVAETKRIQDGWNKSKEREGEIVKRLEVVTADNVGFSNRLRDYRSRLRALSALAESTGQPDPTSGVSQDLEQAETDHFAACARDAERLTQFQAFYESLRAVQ